jgi:ABC-type phosphate/phosphonate transport system substrate-binding protein
LADFRGRRFAFNSADSVSGYLTLVEQLRLHGLARDSVAWLETGAHRASITAVAERRADAAAIDAVCWSLAQAYEPAAVARLRVLDRTRRRSAVPFITSAVRPPEEVAAIRSALFAALAAPATADARAALRLAGAMTISEAQYLAGLGLDLPTSLESEVEDQERRRSSRG